MRTPALGVSAFVMLLTNGCTCAPNAAPDAGVDVSFDSSAMGDSPSDGSADAPSFDAPLGPPRSYWRNPSPPTCSQREDPPRWRVTTDPGPVGSVRWVRSLRERDFENWRVDLANFLPIEYRNTAPSLTGDGIASWIFVAAFEDQHRMVGLNHADGSWGNAATTDFLPYPRMWLPDVYVYALGIVGTRMFSLRPPEYYFGNTPADHQAGLVDPSGMFGPDIRCGGAYDAREGPMPAWSPITGEMVGFGNGPAGRVGVGVGCVEGNRWFTEIPGLYVPSVVNYVRPDGDVIVTSLGHIYVLDGETGEPLRSVDLIESGIVAEPVYHRVAAYHPGCGLLVHRNIENQSWFWVNDETMAQGPDLRLPADRPTSPGGWSGTPDCGLVASAGMGNLVRLNADGSVRYNTPIPAGFIAPSSAPVALADGGTLLMTDPPGWIRFTAAGEITSTVHLDPTVVGERNASPDAVLAPDGTMYFMTLSAFSEIRFAAASTGAIPGPYLWPNSGLNWARTNSILPD